MHIVSDAIAEPDTGTAVAALQNRLRAQRAAPPSFLAVHGSAAHASEAVRQGLSAVGAAALHGGTSCLGVMAEGRMAIGASAGLGVFAVWDPEGQYGTACAASGDDPVAAGRAATLAALAAAGRPGEAPDLLWLTATPGAEEAIIAGVESVVGPNTPIIGGSAADNDVSGGWAVFDGARSLAEGVVVSVLFPSRPVSYAYQNGYAPTAHRGTVTAAQGLVLRTIDGRPAAGVYAEWTGGAVAPDVTGGPVSILSESTFHPLGRDVARIADVRFYLLAHPAAGRPDGALELFARIEEGQELCLMTGSEAGLTARAGRVAGLSLRRGGFAPGAVAGALVTYCGGCMLAVRGNMDRVAREVDAALGGAPSLGVFTFGEQGTVLDGHNRHGNLMISCVAFAR